MKFILYPLLFILFGLLVIKDKKNLRKDEYCKEGLFYQFIYKRCTPRDFIYDENKQQKT